MPSDLLADLFISADSFAKGEHSPGYFGYLGADLERWIAEERKRPHHVLMGRVTYEMMAGLPEEARDEGYRSMTQQTTTVFSRTLTSPAWPGARVVATDLVERVVELKRTSEVPLRTVGSISVVRQLLNARLVDRLRLMVFPLFVGRSGSEPAFEGLEEGELELVDHRVLDRQTLLVEYRPTGSPIP